MVAKVITIAQQKGGAGKTTIASNLAVALAQSNKNSVAVLDTDPQGSMGRWCITREENFADKKGVAQLTLRTASAWGARYEARSLAKEHDFVVIDTPPKMGLDGRPAVEAADLVLVPMTPSEMDKWATEPTLELIEREKQDSLIVLNRVNPRTNLVQRMRVEIPKMGVKLAKTEINQRVIYADVISSGLSVLEKSPSSEAAKEILALRKEIMRRLKD